MKEKQEQIVMRISFWSGVLFDGTYCDWFDHLYYSIIL